MTSFGMFFIRQMRLVDGKPQERIISAADSLDGARTACRTHLLEDGEEGPLKISVEKVVPSRVFLTVSTATLENGRVHFQETDVTKGYE